MQSAGINYLGDFISDGNLHRFHVEGHTRGSKNGAYILHSDGCPAGWFMDYKTGINQKWRISGSWERIPCQMIAEIEKAKREREAEKLQRHVSAAKKARTIWNRSKPILEQSEHAYLVTKYIQSNGARLYREALVILLLDARKQIVNLQFISAEGEKKFLSGGKKKGCFCPIGRPTPIILITEGFATGASLHEETGHCVIVAFDAGNLKPVAEVIRKMFPTNEIIICGDNDLSGLGQTKAREAARAISSKATIPPIAGMDWNDYLVKGDHNG
ncbi:putative DNA primase/helicase [Nitrosomonas ureae]|nr:putative DNA primase/helicase [Nitrosomonas ureae]